MNKKINDSTENMEIKDYQSKNLNIELDRKEHDLIKNMKLQQEYEDDKIRIYGKNRRLSSYIIKLKKGIEMMGKEILQLKEDNEYLRLNKNENSGDEVRNKNELADYYKEELERREELIKAHESNFAVKFIVIIRMLRKDVKYLKQK